VSELDDLERLGRKTIDFYELIGPLERIQTELGFIHFSEFLRQIVRQFIAEYEEQTSRNERKLKIKDYE
jgi:metal-responsive CopG/Arc/MetJ family transcriptional regulator